jgi:hypothetical protein
MCSETENKQRGVITHGPAVHWVKPLPAQMAPTTIEAFWPPSPKLLDST